MLSPLSKSTVLSTLGRASICLALASPLLFGGPNKSNPTGLYARPGQAGMMWVETRGATIWLNGAQPDRGVVEYSTNGGSSWLTLSTTESGNVASSGNLMRYRDTNAGDSTTTATNAFLAYRTGGSVTTQQLFAFPDTAPTDITSPTALVLDDTLVGDLVTTLTPTDVGDAAGSYWEIDSQSTANAFAIAFDASSNTATLVRGTGTWPAVGQTLSVTVRFYDYFQTDSAGAPISGQGFSKTLTFTVKAALAGFSSEFSANTFTTNSQGNAALARLSNGNFVVAWRSTGQDGDSTSNGGIYARIYNSTGVAQTTEFRLSPNDDVNQAAPSVAALSGGRFVVTYTDAGNSNDAVYRIVAADNSLGSVLTAHASTTGAQSNSRVATLSDGNFVIVWVNPNNSNDISARRFSGTDGTPLAAEFTVNTTTTGAQSFPDVAALDSGKFVVTWRDAANAGDIFAQRADASGLVGSEFLVATGTTNQTTPRAAGFPDGKFVIAFAGTGVGGDSTSEGNIYFNRYASDGTITGSATGANVYTLGNQNTPAISGFSDGSFLIAWPSVLQDGDLSGIFGRRFDSSGTAIDSDDVQINARRQYSQIAPAVVTGPSGAFVAAWSDLGQEGSSGVEARVYSGVVSDTTAPTVTSIVRKTPSTQNLAGGTTTVTFTVTYSEAVTGVVAANFQLESVNSGTVTGTIGTPTGGPTVYDVPVTITGGSGEFRLKVIN